jgi:hypothetical protein
VFLKNQAAIMDDYCDPKWPPGTIKLQELLGEGKNDTEIILQPRPTDDPSMHR